MEYLALFRLAAIVAIFYLLWPIVMQRTMRLAVKPLAAGLDLQGKVISEFLPEDFAEAAAALETEGFERVAVVNVAQAVGGVQAFLMLWVNRGACDLASVSSVFDTTGSGQPKLNYVEFVTRFRNGTVVETSNSSSLSPFPPKPQHHSGKFPQVYDVRLLYRLHREQCRRFAPMYPKVMRLDTDFDGDGAAYVAGIMAEDFARQVDTGYLWLPSGSRVYQPTLKGAFLMGWKALFPIKQLRQVSCRRAGQRLIDEIAIASHHEAPRDELGLRR